MNLDRKRAEDVGMDWTILPKPLAARPSENRPIEIQAEDSSRPETKFTRKRRREPMPHIENRIWMNSRVDRVRQIAFCQQFDNYVQMPDDYYSPRLLELSSNPQLPQIDKFRYQDRQFIAVAWLSAVRIFEYSPSDCNYFEIRRVPHRYIGFEGDLITGVHYQDCKLYIAYINTTPECKSYVEIRLLDGKLLESYKYHHTIKSISSSQDFICVKTTQNIIYLHKKSAFTFNPYCIDMTLITDAPLIGINAKPVILFHKTHLRILTVTHESLILSKRDAIEHRITQNYNFDPSYRTISMHLHDNLVLLHRNLIKNDFNQPQSKLEIGSLANASRTDDQYFVHCRSISFTHEIVQIEPSFDRESIFVLGKDGTTSYEVGQLSLKHIKPVWSSKLSDANANTRLLAQQDHLVVILDHQRHIVLGQKDRNDANILRDVKQAIAL